MPPRRSVRTRRNRDRDSYRLDYAARTGDGRSIAITAAAQILQAPRIKRGGRRDQKKGSSQPWQADAWELYDLIGELWFGINWLANAASRARLVAARLPAGGADPVPIEEGLAAELVADWAGGVGGQSQFLLRAGTHLTLAGDSYFVGRTVRDDAGADDGGGPGPGATGPARGLPPTGSPTDSDGAAGGAGADDGEQEWCAYSTDEVSYDSDTWRVNDGGGAVFAIGESDIIMRCWRPHPRRYVEAQSPIRPALPVLRELRGLTMHVAAQVDSRLAGAGILFVPQSMTFPTGQGAQGGDATEGEDPFIRDLLDAMLTPIKDRDSAAAVVPLVVKVPDDSIGKVQHVTFAQPLDEKAKDLRDEALRRFARGMDIPPEIILGLGDTNHWSAWQVDEASVRLHVEPLLATICLALTVGWLRPALEAAGVPDAADYLVWFDTTELVQRPNRAAEAQALFDRFAISSQALRRESGFGEEDAPDRDELARMVLLNLVKGGGDITPLLQALGLPADIADPADGTDGDAGAVDGAGGGGGGRSLPELPGGQPGGDAGPGT